MHNGMHTYEQMLQITVVISLRLVFVFSRLFLIWGQLVCTGVNFAFLRILRFLYFLLSLDECHSLPVQSTAWKTVSEITCCVSSVTWKKLTHSPAREESTKSVPGGRGCQKCARLKKMRKNLRRSAAFKQQWKKRERHGAVPWCQAICSRTWGHDERCLADGSIPRHHTSVWTRQLLVARQCAYTFAQWRVDRRRWLLPLWYKPSRLFQSTVHLYKHTQCTQ